MKKLSYILILTFITYLLVSTFADTSKIATANAAVASCLVYGLQDFSSTDTQPITYNLVTKTVSKLGPELDDYNMESIEIHPTTNVIYGLPRGGPHAGKLVIIDGASGAITPIGSSNNNFNLSSLAFRKTDNTLWTWDKDTGVLYRINTSTNALTAAYSNTSMNKVEALAWDNSGNTLYFTREGSQRLLAFNSSNSTVSTIVNSLPDTVEGMDTLSNGNLLMSSDTASGQINIFSYNVSTKSVVENILINTQYTDLEGIAYPDNCNPSLSATPTPTPTRTPTPTPTRTPTPTPTRTPTPTPTRTPTPTPTRTPTPTPTRTPSPTPTSTPNSSSPQCSPNCSTKEIGAINALFNTFSAEGDNTIEMNDSNLWVRLTIQGPAPLSSSNIIVNELIDSNNFTIVEPKYTSASDYTFKITKRNGTSETDITCTDGSDPDTIPDCVTKLPSTGNITGLNVTITNATSSDIYYIYFKVNAIRSLNNAQIDSPLSQIEYVGFGSSNPNRIVPLAMKQVNISAARPYFQVSEGDVYSGSQDSFDSVESSLPSSSSFDPTNRSVVIARGGANWGNGNVNQHGWEIHSYSNVDLSSYSYNKFSTDYAEKIVNVDLTNQGYNAITRPGYYIDSTSGNPNYVLTLDDTWNNQVIENRQIVIFVPGDLQINKSFSIAKDGKSSAVFIVQGNIGIDPDVTKVEGIYIADGVIDTSCRGGFVNRVCGPDSTDSLSSKPLVLEGNFFSRTGGFNLDRKPTTSSAGETFKFRPDLLFTSTTAVGQKKYYWSENLK